MRYQANIKKAIPLNNETPIESHSLKGIEFSIYGSSNIYENEIQKYADYNKLKDSTFEKCLNLLNSAWKLLDAKNSGPVGKPLLQTYFKILERLTKNYLG